MSKNINVKANDDVTYITLKNLKLYKTKEDELVDRKVANNTAQVFKAQKTDLNTSDSTIIQKYFTDHSNERPRKGDIFIVETLVNTILYEMSSYCYLNDKWEAITGCVDADKVILRSDIKMAGAYTQVGNLTKPQTGTADFAVKGKSVADALQEIFTKTLQPKITAQPSVSGFALSGARAVEVGTKIETASFGTAQLSSGSYEFGPATGITAQSFKVDRIAQPSSFNKESIATTASGTDNNNGAGFIIGDGTEANVVASLAYKVTVNHNEGVVANNNLGGASNPAIKINAGSKTQQTGAYTGFRSFFYGTSNDKPALDSSYIRKLTNSNRAYSAQVLTITIPVGASRICIACLGTTRGVTKVINESAMNADVTSTFIKSTVNVEGANGYTAKPYSVWVYEPLEPYSQSQTLKVTLG